MSTVVGTVNGLVFPVNQGSSSAKRPFLYSNSTDVGNILNTAFSDTSNPTASLVADMIARTDSWIDQVSGGHNWLVNQITEEKYDAIGSGPRAGTILLKKRPILSVQKVEYWQPGVGTNNAGAWVPGVQAYPTETVNMPLVGPSNNLVQPDSYYVYLSEGKIVWHKLRLDDRQRYRVSYTWGYATVPDFIRDLSATATAREIVLYWAGQFTIAEDLSLWKERVDQKINRLIFQAARRQPIASFS